MKPPQMLERERKEAFQKRSNRYWYRWMGLYTLALVANVALIYAAQQEAYAAMVSMLAGLMVAGIAITGWLAKQRALDDMNSEADPAIRQAPSDS
ncbi:MAG: hypothetical protein ABR578_13555 [Chromatocurvus sp.]